MGFEKKQRNENSLSAQPTVCQISECGKMTEIGNKNIDGDSAIKENEQHYNEVCDGNCRPTQCSQCEFMNGIIIGLVWDDEAETWVD